MSTLHRYQDKKLRITTEDGAVFTGIAEVFSSGYGLHEFDREEEGIELGDVILFKSDIRSIEELSETVSGGTNPRRFDTLMGALLDDASRLPTFFALNFEQLPADDVLSGKGHHRVD